SPTTRASPSSGSSPTPTGTTSCEARTPSPTAWSTTSSPTGSSTRSPPSPPDASRRPPSPAAARFARAPPRALCPLWSVRPRKRSLRDHSGHAGPVGRTLWSPVDRTGGWVPTVGKWRPRPGGGPGPRPGAAMGWSVRRDEDPAGRVDAARVHRQADDVVARHRTVVDREAPQVVAAHDEAVLDPTVGEVGELVRAPRPVRPHVAVDAEQHHGVAVDAHVQAPVVGHVLRPCGAGFGHRPVACPAVRPPSVDALARSIADIDLPHPNLGRAPFGHTQPPAYTNLELDLATGTRGSRRAHAGALLARASGAASALVVNNGAAAVLLVLAALARGKGVAVSRGELVEIGGGFRVPEVMAESGARLVEVGTTNRTRRADYEQVGDDVALLLKVHRSNYRITGFTEDTPVEALTTIGPPVVVDLGSGLLDRACPWLPDGPPPWLHDEPAVRQTLDAGAALVVFSGDKLLGGPQAGIIAGRADLVDACARHPLYRAFRPGGLVLGALQDVALAYLRRDRDALS